ncbi:MAG: Holliday junction branch migration protein RuvA [Candidatus Atribacteria bacterium]|nr:Holliday junction branch migration protein RuvA [Candidatus Atribacteria bacterium]
MIAFLKGKIESKESDSVVVNVNGIGYTVYVPSSEKFLAGQNDQIIFTYLYVREDRIVLYGFLSKGQRDFFKILLDTPGIGPKVGMSILSNMEPEQFQRAVIEENLNMISSISGIGNKLAKKIILELKEKLKKSVVNLSFEEESGKKDIIDDGVEVLKSLGYSEKEAKIRISTALKKLKNQQPLTLEDLIKNALSKTKNEMQ